MHVLYQEGGRGAVFLPPYYILLVIHTCTVYTCIRNFMHSKMKLQLGSLKYLFDLLAMLAVSVTRLSDRDKETAAGVQWSTI